MECATQALALIHTSQYSVLSPQVSEMKQSNCSFTSFEAHWSACMRFDEAACHSKRFGAHGCWLAAGPKA